jgi:hypothetical protein
MIQELLLQAPENEAAARNRFLVAEFWPKFFMQPVVRKRWCKPPTSGISITLPHDGC